MAVDDRVRVTSGPFRGETGRVVGSVPEHYGSAATLVLLDTEVTPVPVYPFLLATI